MKECITTAKMSMTVDGSPTEPFHIHRRLSQGHPLDKGIHNISLFLFVLVAEVLIRCLR